MAIETEEKYHNFLLSTKGLDIQKRIYLSNLEDEEEKSEKETKIINMSVQELKSNRIGNDKGCQNVEVNLEKPKKKQPTI